MTAKSTKNSRHKSRKSFKALARELLCNITHPPISCRSCLNVSISGTTELAFHAQASTLFSTAQTSAVQFPLLKLTLTLAQHHAGFILNYLSVRTIVGIDRCIYLILSPCFRGTATKLQRVTVGAGSACPDIPPQFLPLTLMTFILF